MDETGAVPPQEMPFGDALAELESIVASLEGGQLELEESMSRYERGVELLRELQAKLASAQQKVTMLIGELEADEPAGTVEADEPAGTVASDED